MKHRDLLVVARIIASIEDHWARAQAVNQACFRLGSTYTNFDATTFRWMIGEAEKSSTLS